MESNFFLMSIATTYFSANLFSNKQQIITLQILTIQYYNDCLLGSSKSKRTFLYTLCLKKRHQTVAHNFPRC